MAQDYRRSWTGFILWLILFMAAIILIGMLPIQQGSTVLRLILLTVLWGIQALLAIILHNGHVDWFSGVSYEDAKAAGSTRRTACARKHFRRFGYLALLCTAEILISWMLDFPAWIDTVLTCIGLIGVSVSTVFIQL